MTTWLAQSQCESTARRNTVIEDCTKREDEIGRGNKRESERKREKERGRARKREIATTAAGYVFKAVVNDSNAV